MLGLPRRATMAPSSALLLLSAALPLALGHGHDSSKIEDGKTISADPIVRGTLDSDCWERSGCLFAHDTAASDSLGVGHDIMDTHLHPDGRLGSHLPAGHGSWGKE